MSRDELRVCVAYHFMRDISCDDALVITLLSLLMNGNPGQKWLESQLPVYQELKVHIYKHQDVQYMEQEKRYDPETKESSEPPKIKTAKTG